MGTALRRRPDPKWRIIGISAGIVLCVVVAAIASVKFVSADDTVVSYPW